MPIQVSLLNIIFLSVQRIIVKNLGSSLWLHAGLPLHCHFLAHPENYCCRKSWILVMTLIFKPISWLKYLGRNRRRYWCGALQLRLWKHDHVRPGSLTFWLIYEVSKLLTIFITDHISPHTQATLACNRPEDSMPCDQVQIHCAGQFNVWQKQLRRTASTTRSSTERSKWRRRREDPETSRHVPLTRLVQIWICRALRDPQEQWDPSNHLDESQQVAQVQMLTFAGLQKAIRYLRLPFNWRPKHFRDSKCSFPN